MYIHRIVYDLHLSRNSPGRSAPTQIAKKKMFYSRSFTANFLKAFLKVILLEWFGEFNGNAAKSGCRIVKIK